MVHKTKKEYGEISPNSRQEWRTWLETNGTTSKGIFLIYYKAASGKKTVSYDDAVEEALCFGWIDSVVKSIDDEKYKQFFSPRKRKSVWSKLNKTRIIKLTEQNLIHQTGLQVIEQAKLDGSWTSLDDVEALQIPQDLQQALDENSKAKQYFEKFAPSSKKGILGWIKMAKKSETRRNRIEKTVSMASRNKRVNFDKE